MTFTGHSDRVYSVAFSPDGTKVLTGSKDNTARLWDVVSGTKIRTFSGHGGDVMSVAYSPDGTKVLTGSQDYTARLWDATTGTHIATFTGHSGVVHSVAFSPDGKKVLTGSEDKTARLWPTFRAQLDVTSSPYNGVFLSGTHGGTTSYQLVFMAHENVLLSAQLRIFPGSVPCNFAYWKMNGIAQQPRQTDIQFRIEADTAVEAVYDILGDANGDCVVNVLDLITIRNRLGANSEDSWRGDVNLDRSVDVLDLISARNKLGTRCE